MAGARKCGNVVWDIEADKSLGGATHVVPYSAPGITATELHGDLDQWARATGWRRQEGSYRFPYNFYQELIDI